MPIRGAGRIVDLFQKRIQPRLIAQRQNYIELQYLGWGKESERLCLTVTRYLSHMMGQHRLSLTIHCRDGQNPTDRDQAKTHFPNHDFSF
jgi:hypothetical protein